MIRFNLNFSLAVLPKEFSENEKSAEIVVEVREPKIEVYKTCEKEKGNFESGMEDINTTSDSTEITENSNKQLKEVYQTVLPDSSAIVSTSSTVQRNFIRQTHINLEVISDKRVRQNCYCEKDILVSNTRMINI